MSYTEQGCVCVCVCVCITFQICSLFIQVIITLVAQMEESILSVGDLCLIPGLGRSPGEGHGNTLQHSCLENPMDRGVWRAIVSGVTESWT